MAATLVEKGERFRALHARPGAFVIPNPWDAGTACLLASLGFEALTTTSAGLAFTLGKRDGSGTREETLANAKASELVKRLESLKNTMDIHEEDNKKAKELVPVLDGLVKLISDLNKAVKK